MIDYTRIPPTIRRAIDGWARDGELPGGFLQAVLRNDLAAAVGRADPQSLAALGHTVAYLFNCCPAGCWGSGEKVEAWPEHMPESRRRAFAAAQRDGGIAAGEEATL